MENTNETLNKSDKSALHNGFGLCVRWGFPALKPI